jgi:hypothetical protein
MNVRARHRYHSHGTRYQIDMSHELHVEDEVSRARQTIESFMRRTHATVVAPPSSKWY